MALNQTISVNLCAVFTGKTTAPTTESSAFTRLARSGATGVEIPFDDQRWSFDWAAEVQRELVRAVDEDALRVSGIALHHLVAHNPASASADVRGRALRAIRNALRIAGPLGVSTVVVAPGLPERRVSFDDSYEAAAQTLAQAARYAADEGVTLAVENIPAGFLQSAREFRIFLDDIGSSCVKACLDLGNVLAANQPFPQNWILELRQRIEVVHANDYALGPVRETRPLGDGDVPWDDALQALDEIGYEGWLVVEASDSDGEIADLEHRLAMAERSVGFITSALERTRSHERTTPA